MTPYRRRLTATREAWCFGMLSAIGALYEDAYSGKGGKWGTNPMPKAALAILQSLGLDDLRDVLAVAEQGPMGDKWSYATPLRAAIQPLLESRQIDEDVVTARLLAMKPERLRAT